MLIVYCYDEFGDLVKKVKITKHNNPKRAAQDFVSNDISVKVFDTKEQKFVYSLDMFAYYWYNLLQITHWQASKIVYNVNHKTSEERFMMYFYEKSMGWMPKLNVIVQKKQNFVLKLKNTKKFWKTIPMTKWQNVRWKWIIIFLICCFKAKLKFCRNLAKNKKNHCIIV